MTIKFLLLTIFGIAMAHFEGVVVVYLRKAMGISGLNAENTEILQNIPKHFKDIEMTRETATIVMLVSLSALVGTSWLDKVMVFLWTFAFWDLFYYVSLYILIKWPSSLKTIDVLFLIPRPWIAPVWLPVGISILTIISVWLFYILPL